MIALGLANSGPAYLASWSGDAKTAIVGADKVLIWDSEASNFKETTVSNLLGGLDVLMYKGAIDCSANPNYPAADAGHEYRISAAGRIGGAAGPIVQAGDIVICNTDGTVVGTHAAVGASWNIIQLNVQRPIEGPASSTDNAFSKFDGTDGDTLQNSKTTEDDIGNVTVTGEITTEQVNTEKVKGLTNTGGAGLELHNATGTGMNIDSSGNVTCDGNIDADVGTFEEVSTERVVGLSTTGGVSLELYNANNEGVIIDNDGDVGVGIETPTAKLHIDQDSTSGAKPVLTVDQADVSEEFIKFIGTSANSVLTQSLVEDADVTTATLQGWIKIFVQDDGNQLTDQAYYVPIYTLE